MDKIAKNSGVAGSQNGMLYINENIMDKTMKITGEAAIPLYEITSGRYNTATLPNLAIFFDLPLGDIIDDTIVGEQLIYNKYSEKKSNVTLNLVRTETELPGALQTYLYN